MLPMFFFQPETPQFALYLQSVTETNRQMAEIWFFRKKNVTLKLQKMKVSNHVSAGMLAQKTLLISTRFGIAFD